MAYENVILKNYKLDVNLQINLTLYILFLKMCKLSFYESNLFSMKGSGEGRETIHNLKESNTFLQK